MPDPARGAEALGARACLRLLTAGVRSRRTGDVRCFTGGAPRARLANVKSEHLPLLHSVSAPAVHPDGSRAVVSVIRPDFDADAYVGQLWTVPLGGEATDQDPMDPGQRPRRLTRGFRDTAP